MIFYDVEKVSFLRKVNNFGLKYDKLLKISFNK